MQDIARGETRSCRATPKCKLGLGCVLGSRRPALAGGLFSFHVELYHEVQAVTAFTICTNCKRTVMVSSSDDEPPCTQDYPIVVYCPGCGHPNVVVWCRATRYSVTLAGEPR